MELRIDGNLTRVVPGKSLRELIIELGLDTADLSTRPLAARLAGEVFTLNYIPVRMKDAVGETVNTRTAMAASDGQIALLRYSDPAGKDTYVRECRDYAIRYFGKNDRYQEYMALYQEKTQKR